MHVAMVVASEYDVDARVRRQAEALVARGDTVTVLALGKTDAVVRRDLLGVHVVELPVRKYRGYSAGTYLRYYARFGWHAMRELARLRGLDLVQVHSMPEVLVFCAWRQRLRGVPVLLDVHDLTSKLFETKFSAGRRVTVMRLLERASFVFASRTMTVHEPYARMLRRTFGRAVGPCPVVMNVPDGARWSPRPWLAWDEAVTFGFHGSLVDRYGVLDMLDALARVRAVRPGARLVIRGDGEARPAMLARIEELGLQDAVDMSDGYVPHDAIRAELAGVHIGLAPYRRDEFMQDSLPSKLLEYVAMQIPVVSARLPYIEELFGDAVRFVEPGDVAGLAEQMLRAADEPQRSKEMACAAYQVLEALSWPTQRQTYFDVVDELVTRRRASRRGRRARASGT
jgi:glycosyltransferase involved in cell wall biosynthesis